MVRINLTPFISSYPDSAVPIYLSYIHLAMIYQFIQTIGLLGIHTSSQ